jgi:hypothetical protein
MAGFQLTLHGRIWVTPEDNPIAANETNNKIAMARSAIRTRLFSIVFPFRRRG